MKHIHIRLREILNERGMTQKDLADQTSVSRQTISNFVNQPVGIKLDSLATICEALELEPGDLLVLKE